MDILTGYICDYICVDAHKVFPSYHSQLVSSYYSLSAVGVYLEQIQIHHSKTDTAIPIFGLQSFMEIFFCIAGKKDLIYFHIMFMKCAEIIISETK